jgi:hypothetical protein
MLFGLTRYTLLLSIANIYSSPDLFRYIMSMNSVSVFSYTSFSSLIYMVSRFYPMRRSNFQRRY